MKPTARRWYGCASRQAIRVSNALARLLGRTHKPFVSALYRYLGVRRPAVHPAASDHAADRSVGDYYLARIRPQLARHAAS